MKYQKLFLLTFLLFVCGVSQAAAQQPTKIKKPVKNPPQYPSIIDLENKDAQAGQQGKQGAADPAAEPQAQPNAAASDALTQTLTALAGEMRTLVQEMRAMNLRQQAALDMLRMTRVDLRIDHYESELRPVRERIAALEAEEQNLYQLMTRDSLLAQSANIGTINRDQTMQQIKLNHEARLRYVQAEKDRLRKVESDLIASLGIYQNMGNEADRRIQAVEEQVRQLEATREPVKKDPNQPESKPDKY